MVAGPSIAPHMEILISGPRPRTYLPSGIDRLWPRKLFFSSLLQNSDLHGPPKRPPWDILHTINREQGFHPARESGEKPCSALDYHSPLEGESARQGRMPAVEPVGGQRGVARVHSPQSSRLGGRLPVPMSLPGREEGDGRILGTPASAPHRISLRQSARLLRLPLKGGVILEFF